MVRIWRNTKLVLRTFWKNVTFMPLQKMLKKCVGKTRSFWSQAKTCCYILTPPCSHIVGPKSASTLKKIFSISNEKTTLEYSSWYVRKGWRATARTLSWSHFSSCFPEAQTPECSVLPWVGLAAPLSPLCSTTLASQSTRNLSQQSLPFTGLKAIWGEVQGFCCCWVWFCGGLFFFFLIPKYFVCRI